MTEIKLDKSENDPIYLAILRRAYEFLGVVGKPKRMIVWDGITVLHYPTTGSRQVEINLSKIMLQINDCWYSVWCGYNEVYNIFVHQLPRIHLTDN